MVCSWLSAAPTLVNITELIWYLLVKGSPGRGDDVVACSRGNSRGEKISTLPNVADIGTKPLPTSTRRGGGKEGKEGRKSGRYRGRVGWFLGAERVTAIGRTGRRGSSGCRHQRLPARINLRYIVAVFQAVDFRSRIPSARVASLGGIGECSIAGRARARGPARA